MVGSRLRPKDFSIGATVFTAVNLWLAARGREASKEVR